MLTFPQMLMKISEIYFKMNNSVLFIFSHPLKQYFHGKTLLYSIFGLYVDSFRVSISSPFFVCIAFIQHQSKGFYHSVPFCFYLPLSINQIQTRRVTFFCLFCFCFVLLCFGDSQRDLSSLLVCNKALPLNANCKLQKTTILYFLSLR